MGTKNMFFQHHNYIISHVHTNKHTNTTWVSTLDSLLKLTSKCRKQTKKQLRKQTTRRKPAKFSFFSNGRSQAGKIFFVLSQTRIRRGYLAFWLPALTNGLLLSVKADF